MVSTREGSKPPPGEAPRRGTRDRSLTVAYTDTDPATLTSQQAKHGKGNKSKKVIHSTKPTKASARVKENQLKEKKRQRTGPPPKVLTDPVSGETVWVAPANKSTLQLAARKQRPPWLLSRRYLVTVPCALHRQTVYARAADALAELETRILPTYGNRPWQCVVTFKEPTISAMSSGNAKKKAAASSSGTSSKQSPYFCWDKRGRLELAAFPHLVDKMPSPPHFPGYRVAGSSSSSKRRRERQERQAAAALLAAAPPVETATTEASATAAPMASSLSLAEDCKTSGSSGSTVALVSDGAEVTASVEADSAVTTGTLPDLEANGTAKVETNMQVEEEEEDDEEEEDEEFVSDELLDLRELQERKVSGLSQLAWDLKWRVPVPTVHFRWISPLRQSFATRKSAWDHAVQLCQQEVLLDRVLLGFGAHGKPIKLAPQSRPTVLKAGKLRFERDGLWVVGQEEEWGLERLAALAPSVENGQAKCATTLSHTHSEATMSFLSVSTTKIAPEASTTSTASAVGLPSPRRPLSGLAYFIQCRRKDHQRTRLNELQELAHMNESKAVQITVAGKLNIAGPVAIDPPSASAPDTSESFVGSPSPVAVPPLSSPLPLHAPKLDTQQKAAESAAVVSPRIAFSIKDAEKELRIVWKSLKESERQQWVEDARQEQARLDASVDAIQEAAVVKGLDDSSSSSSAGTVCAPASTNFSAASSVEDLEVSKCFPNSAFRRLDDEKLPVVSASPSPPAGLNVPRVPMDTPEHACNRVTLDTPVVSPSSAPIAPVAIATSVVVAAKAQSQAKQDCARGRSHLQRDDFARSKKWCLNEEQIKQCYKSGMEHYDQVLRTVSARDLTQELQDGFDVLRERGKGRWDMNLPEWDSPDYWFLNDTKKAPWMPIVKEILGKEVVLIHKGMFLSMPGSSKQVYHQDGPHLTTQYQKPCHAINVFVPLVDLSLDNGPTEFCLGSHILGHEALDDAFLHIPTVGAGTPIIFDYRLGHRGLANDSASCRPIVYCTYAAAADGKEFRDSVNFSRKRYHRIGELVEKGLTREQRAQKRKQSAEEQLVEDALAASLPSTKHNGLNSSSSPQPTKKPRRALSHATAMEAPKATENETTSLATEITVLEAGPAAHTSFSPQSPNIVGMVHESTTEQQATEMSTAAKCEGTPMTIEHSDCVPETGFVVDRSSCCLQSSEKAGMMQAGASELSIVSAATKQEDTTLTIELNDRLLDAGCVAHSSSSPQSPAKARTEQARSTDLQSINVSTAVKHESTPVTTEEIDASREKSPKKQATCVPDSGGCETPSSSPSLPEEEAQTAQACYTEEPSMEALTVVATLHDGVTENKEASMEQSREKESESIPANQSANTEGTQ